MAHRFHQRRSVIPPFPWTRQVRNVPRLAGFGTMWIILEARLCWWSWDYPFQTFGGRAREYSEPRCTPHTHAYHSQHGRMFIHTWPYTFACLWYQPLVSTCLDGQTQDAARGTRHRTAIVSTPAKYTSYSSEIRPHTTLTTLRPTAGPDFISGLVGIHPYQHHEVEI
jgi:hypothetical protein